MKKFFRGLFSHVRLHHKPQEMPHWVRKRLYDNLLLLMDEEENARQLLKLPIKPRLSIVDEERVVMICPSDRKSLRLDEQMQQARKDKKEADEPKE
ncbi:hypothetical protein GPM19_00650 [Halomonas sp. ZH2S]|uniref:Uncharacterized protein n=1 Tax=Vreelandella zhuhanensis TaxID=2684210 RepID=A0A7X3KPD6_9GAMM|nr:hypothetical protein [Halomonas zhuhanensis]MWJ26728.1 hypothetical protein [Halomonas zhuhanensis]